MAKINDKAIRLAAPARTAMRRSVTSAPEFDKPVPQPLSRLTGRVAIQSPIIIEKSLQNFCMPRSGRAPNPPATPSSTKDSFKSLEASKSVRPSSKALKRVYAQSCNEKSRITGGFKPPSLAERFAESKAVGVKSVKKPACAATKPAVLVIRKNVEKERNPGATQAKIIAVARVAALVVVEKERETTMVSAAITKATANTAALELEEQVCVPEKNDEDDLENAGEKEEERQPTLRKIPALAPISYTPTVAPESYEKIAMKAQRADTPTDALESVDDVLLNVEKKAEAANNFLASFELKMAAIKKTIVVAPALPKEIKEEAKMYNTKYRFQLEEGDADASLLFDYDAVEPSFIFPLPEDVAWEGKYIETETREAKTPDHRTALDYSRECLSLDKPRPSRIPGPSEPILDKPRKHITKIKLETFKMISGGWWLPTNKSLDEDSEPKPLSFEFLPFAFMKPHISGERPIVDHWGVNHKQSQIEPVMAFQEEVFPHWDHWDWNYQERKLGADPVSPLLVCAHEELGWFTAPDSTPELPEIVLTPATRTPSPSSEPVASPASGPFLTPVAKRLRFGDNQIKTLVRSKKEWAEMEAAPAKECPVTKRATGKKHMFKVLVSRNDRSRRETLGDNFMNRYKAVRCYGNRVRIDGEPDYPHDPYGTENWKVGTDHPDQYITVGDIYSPVVFNGKTYWQNGKFRPLHRHGWQNVDISGVLPSSGPRAKRVEKSRVKQQARFGRAAQSKKAVRSSKAALKALNSSQELSMS